MQDLYHHSYDEPESRNEGACIRYMTNQSPNERVVLTCDETESPNKWACFRYMTKRNRQMRGVFQMFDETGIAK